MPVTKPHTAGHYLRRLHRIPHWVYRMMRAHLLPHPVIWWLSEINRHSTASLLDPRGPVISMTTYGIRTSTVFLTIESIGRGSLLPSRIILWLDEGEVHSTPPATLSRLMKRGLEIKLCAKYGPHKKYYPYLQSEPSCHVPLVIADDDQLYPHYWLEHLAAANKAHPETIHCHWSFEVAMEDHRIAPYTAWRRRGSPKPSSRHMAVGASGVIFPPAFLLYIKTAGDAFMQRCPRADDVWLHHLALQAGYKVRQLRKRELQSLQIPGSQKQALAQENDRGGNDHQIAATYTPEDIEVLLLDWISS